MSYLRVSILGTTVGGEVWSVNPAFVSADVDPVVLVTQSNLDAASNGVANVALPADLKTLLSTALSQIGARIEVRQDTNDQLIALSEFTFPNNQPGTGTPKMSAQAAVVVSTLTNTPGARGRGRLYWPAVGAGIDSSLRLTSPTTTNVATAMKSYIDAIESALGTAFDGATFNLAVRSKTAATTPKVARLRVGNVIDNQRRRRDSLVESYATVNM